MERFPNQDYRHRLNHLRYPLALVAALALAIAPEIFAQTVPPEKEPGEKEASEKPALADFPTLLGALSESANPRWRNLYRPPVPPRSDRNLGAIALGGVIADVYLAAEAYDVRQVKNLCIELETHSRVLGINEGSAGETRRLADAAGKEDWKAAEIAAADLRARLHALLLAQRDPDLASLIEVGFWLRALEISSAAVFTEPEATDLPLCIGSTDRLKLIASRIDNLAEPMRKLPFVVEIREEINRLIRRWEDPENEADREDVDLSHAKVRNLLRRILER